jgi:hypothetical protein
MSFLDDIYGFSDGTGYGFDDIYGFSDGTGYGFDNLNDYGLDDFGFSDGTGYGFEDFFGEGTAGTGDASWGSVPNALGGVSNLSTWQKLMDGIGLNRETALGGLGLTGALAALTSKPQVTTATTGSNRSGTTTTETGSPEWYKQLTENLGGAISGDDGSWSDVMGYLGGGAGQAKDMTQADLDSYMNPFTNNVLNPQLTRMNEDFLGQQNKRNANAAMVGAFGQSRNILDNSLATERFDKNVSETTNNALSQAYGNAMNLFGTDRGANQWATGATGDLFAKLKPNTVTGVSSNIGDTQSTTSVGTEPNRLAQLANMGGSIFGLANQS